MELQEAITTRRSVRKYRGQPVAAADIEHLLQAAIYAPSATNAQTWAFGVIQDRARLDEISAAARAAAMEHVNRSPAMEQYRQILSSPTFDMFYHAAALLVIYATPGLQSEINCALAAQNLMLAARDRGLGSCWIGFAAFYLNRPEVKRELGVPETYTAVAPIVVGYAKGKPLAPDRKDPALVYWLGREE